MDTSEVIAGSQDNGFDEAFEQQLAEQFDGDLINLVLEICCCVENIQNIYPEAASLTRRLAVFVENIELRIRDEL